MTKWVYLFSEVEEAEKYAGDWDGVRGLLGGKGANLAEMTRIGVPVPPGFTVTTEACNAYFAADQQCPEGMWDQVSKAIGTIEEEMKKGFGDPASPLLVSCRSGAKYSMPGMMDTVLNIGLNDETAKGMVELTGDESYVYNSYRRLVQMFGSVVFGIEDEEFEHVITMRKRQQGVSHDTELNAEDWKALTEEFKAIVKKHKGFDFPQDPIEQLRLATEAALKSWNGRHAIAYRDREKIPHDLGIGVNIVTMVFGNMGWDSGTGVAFTRNPATGDKEPYGDYLLNAQGEDVIAGIRNTKQISEMEEEMPNTYTQLLDIFRKLEGHYREMQDVEFTIEQGKLWMLQTRDGKRTALASLRISIDFLDENLISEREAIFRVKPRDLAVIFASRLPRDLDRSPIAHGVNASPGVAAGIAVFDADLAEELAMAGNEVILVRPEVTPDDVHGMISAKAVVTSRGTATSHAGVVCLQFGIPAVTGSMIDIDLAQSQFRAVDQVVREGDQITIDGTSGTIYLGKIPLATPDLADDPYLERYASLIWAVNPDDYVEDGLGTLWLLRDTIRDRRVPSGFSSRSPLVTPLTETITSAFEDETYLSFVQPSGATVRDILSTMHWHERSDTESVVWGIMDSLMRSLQNAVGIGNHHLAIRPLNDPEHSFIDLQSRSVVNNQCEPAIQLVGLEFFGVNRFLRNCLPWGCLQWWVAVRLRDSYHSGVQGFWRLDRVNPHGESIIPAECDFMGFVAVLDGMCLDVMQSRQFYSELRKREFGWAWYAENDTSWREVVETLRCVKTHKPVDQTMILKCQRLALLTTDLQLSTAARALLSKEAARDRRQISFLGGKSRDE